MDHPNLVVVHYNQYAGGKFFINCLSHHDQVLPGLCVAAPVHTYDHWIFEDLPVEQKIQRKIARINGTVPERNELHYWARNELGCQQFWGFGFGELWSRPVSAVDYSLNLLQTHRCFIVNHEMNIQCYDRIKNMWPRARHIVLFNESKFQQLSVKLKSPGFYLRTKQLSSDLDAFYFDVDNTLFDKSSVIQRTQQCLEWLGLNTNVNYNLDHYIEKYFAIHQ